MKKSEIQIGHYYVARLSGRMVVLRIEKETHSSTYKPKPFGGDFVNKRTAWLATNMQTNREVSIRSAAKLRYEVVQWDTETGKRWIKLDKVHDGGPNAHKEAISGNAL